MLFIGRISFDFSLRDKIFLGSIYTHNMNKRFTLSKKLLTYDHFLIIIFIYHKKTFLLETVENKVNIHFHILSILEDAIIKKM